MKKIIATIVTAVLMTLSLSSFAITSNNPLKSMEIDAVISTYVEATTVGNTAYNKFLYANDFIYENATNNQKNNKREYLNFLKQNKGLVYNCTTNYEILDTNPSTTMAKTSYKFENFTRIDYITLVKSKEGWKISKLITSYL